MQTNLARILFKSMLTMLGFIIGVYLSHFIAWEIVKNRAADTRGWDMLFYWPFISLILSPQLALLGLRIAGIGSKTNDLPFVLAAVGTALSALFFFLNAIFLAIDLRGIFPLIVLLLSFPALGFIIGKVVVKTGYK